MTFIIPFKSLIIILLLISCSEKTTYTGLILNENINDFEINNKNDLISL